MKETIDLKSLGIRKKIDVSIEDDKCIFGVSQKSRILRKDVPKFEEIYLKIKELKNTEFLKAIKMEAPLCSKAKLELEQNGWEVIV